MSIDEKLASKLKELNGKKVVILDPLVPDSGVNGRILWVTEEVFEAVEPVRDGSWDDCRLSEFRADLDAFSNEEYLGVAEDPFQKGPSASLARVAPLTAEFWDVRILNPRPGIRCLGGFAGRNVFVALVWEYRENIENWDVFVGSGITKWQELFGEIGPYKAGDLNAYLSNFKAV